MPKYPAHQRVSSRIEQDATNPLYREAEDKVLAWLVGRGYEALDVRSQNTYHDFLVGKQGTQPAYALDVKCEGYASATGKVAWEETLERFGKVRDSWGRDSRLSYIAYVLPQTWRMVLVNAGAARAALAEREEADDVTRFEHEGADGRTARGLVVPLDFLRSEGCIITEEQL